MITSPKKAASLLRSALLYAAMGAAGCGTGATSTERTSSGGSGGASRTDGGSSPGTGGSTTSPGGAPGGTGGAGGAPGAGAAIPLPMTVTAQFQNQGWFADPSLAMHFKPGATVIKQMDVTTGPCGMRAGGMRGKCLKVTYTPPTGLMAPASGGWVGVFFLTTLLSAHPELMPAAAAGDANWGVEPGRNIAPGATRISFQAAAEQEGLSVTFKAGTDKDSFVLPEQTETLGAAWKALSLSLAGQSYGNNVIGAFSWVLKDTTRPVTFYLDDIVWE